MDSGNVENNPESVTDVEELSSEEDKIVLRPERYREKYNSVHFERDRSAQNSRNKRKKLKKIRTHTRRMGRGK